jgi:hypothetical protein
MIIKYLYINRYYSIAILYFLLSVFLNKQGIVNVTVPCLFNFLFDIHCPGCGFTRSFIELLKLNFKESLQYNILSLPIIFFIIFYIIKDFMDFKKQLIYIKK